MDIRDCLGIRIESPFWDDAYKNAIEDKTIPVWLTSEYIEKLRDEYGVLRQNSELILKSLPLVVDNENLCLLAKTLYNIIATGKKASETFSYLELPIAPVGTENTLGYDFVGIFPILGHVEPSFKILENRGIDRQVISDSLVTPDNLVTYTNERIGKYGLGSSEFLAYDNAVYVNYLRIGRLRFEIEENAKVNICAFKNKKNEVRMLMNGEYIHKSGNVLGTYGCLETEGSFFADINETSEYYEGFSVNGDTGLCENFKIRLLKSEWNPVLSKSDAVLRVHIPYGDSLEYSVCEDSYNRAREIFSSCYPEIHFSNFVLCCWMLSPLLCEILPDTSNIIQFRKKYYVFPIKSMALDGFMYVFNFRGNSVDDIDIEMLPASNSLMRGLTENALKKRYVYEYGGFFPY